MGATFSLRFSSAHCEGDLLLVTSRDNTCLFYRFSLEETGALTFHYRLEDGHFKVQMRLPNGTSFCDGKEHNVTLLRFKRLVSYKIDEGAEKKREEKRIMKIVFGKPDRIILGGREGKKYNGIIYNAKVDIIWAKRVTSVPLVRKYFDKDPAIRSAGVIAVPAEGPVTLQPGKVLHSFSQPTKRKRSSYWLFEVYLIRVLPSEDFKNSLAALSKDPIFNDCHGFAIAGQRMVCNSRRLFSFSLE